MSAERCELAPGYSICRLLQGGWQLADGHARKPLDRPALLRDLEQAVELGATTFDCADIYTGVESLLGELLRRLGPRGEAIQIHTKLVPDLAVLPGIDRHYVEGIVERSLRRLGRERLDLVQLHWWDFDVPGHLEAAGWLDELRRAGKVRCLGTTNYDALHLAELLDAGVPVVSDQVQYSLLDRRPELGEAPSLVELCQERGVHLLAYGALAGGFLTAAWHGRPEPAGELENRSLVKYRLIIEELGGWPIFQELLGALSEIAKRRGVDPAAVALRWVLDRQAVAGAIVGARSSDRWVCNRAAFALRLEPADLALLDSVLERTRGPGGAVYALERNRQGRHGAIMRYDLNRAATETTGETIEP